MQSQLTWFKIPQTHNGLTITVAEDDSGYYARIAFIHHGKLEVITAGPRTTLDKAVDLCITRVAIAKGDVSP